MTKIDKEAMARSDDAVEQLLANAEPRPTPPPEVIAQARAAVMAEWQQTHRRRSQKWYAVAASVAAASILWFSVGNEQALPNAYEVAAIDKVIGDYHFRQDDGLLEERPEQQIVREGDTIVTGNAAVLGLAWTNGGSLRLDADTSVRFLQQDQIELLAGRIYFDSQHFASQQNTGEIIPLAIHTDYGHVQHLGTQFMTDVRSGDSLRVSVREGKVAINGIYHDADADIGDQVVMRGDSEPLIISLATYSTEWQWVQAAAPAVSMEGKTFEQILEWVCRETGLSSEFEVSVTKRRASTPLAGVEADNPMAVLRLAAEVANLTFTQVDGVIVVSQRGP